MLKESGEAKFHQVLNARDKDGNTLLHHVARNGDLVTVLDLIDENRVTITDLLEKKIHKETRSLILFAFTQEELRPKSWKK